MTPASRYRYAMHVLREDDTSVCQVPVEVDWEPAREAVRLAALRAGLEPADAFGLAPELEPVWHAARGQPYLGGFVAGVASGPGREEFSLAYFRELSHQVTTRLVAEAVLAKGDVIRCLPVAYPQPAEELPDPPARIGRPAPPDIPVHPASLQDAVDRAGLPDPAVDALPVFLPETVLAEVRGLTLAAGPRETGGVLLGRLFRDGGIGRLFVEVTAQVPARHTDASATRLTFTADTWTDVRSALALRGAGELMLGWWHSHPVREWCKDCSEEKRRECAFARGFLSEDDRLLHRTVFPRAYTLALLASDTGAPEPPLNLFGWSGGRLEERSWFTLREPSHASAG
jgi:hypothetical protein